MGFSGLHGPAGGDSGDRGQGLGHRPGVDRLPGGGHGALPVRPGLQGAVVEKTGAGDLAPGLAHHMGELVAQQGLAGDAGKVQRAGGKGDAAALGHGLGSGIGHRLALIEAHSGQIGAEGGLHLGPDSPGQVHWAAQHFLGGLGGSCSESVRRQGGGRACCLSGGFPHPPFPAEIGLFHSITMPAVIPSTQTGVKV